MVEKDFSLAKYSDLWMGKTVDFPPRHTVDGITARNIDHLVRKDQIQLQFTLWGKLHGYMNRRRLELEQLRSEHYKVPLDPIVRNQLILF